jgi:2-iminoacetate synthase ThiH
VVVRYKYCFLVYLVPVQEIVLDHAVSGRIELIVP